MRPASRKGFKIKVVLVGELGVGKTSLFYRIKDGTFGARPSVGNESFNHDVQVDNTTVTIDLWDTAGLERFRTLTGVYYRNCHAVLMLYSVDNPSTLDALDRWNVDILRYSKNDVIRILVGNKGDLTPKLSDKKIKDFADSHKCTKSITISTKTGANVDELLEMTAHQVLQEMNNPKEVENRGRHLSLIPESNDEQASKPCFC